MQKLFAEQYSRSMYKNLNTSLCSKLFVSLSKRNLPVDNSKTEFIWDLV